MNMSIFYKERKFIKGLLLVVIVFILLVVFSSNGIFRSQAGEASLVLTFEKNGEGRKFTGEVIPGMTILTALIASSQAGDIKLDYEGKDNKVTINGLDGFLADVSDKELAFYLNGLKIEEENIHLVAVRAGDIIEVRLE